MELKPGYKQTEVGEIPKDWNVIPLSVFADVKTGPFGSALHERDYVSDGTPIITVEHLGEQQVVHENLPLVSDSDRDRLSSYILRTGDIVFSRVGSVDRNAIIRDSENGWLFSGRLLRVRVLRSDVHPPYLSYHFHSEPFKRRVRTVAVGQTMASLNTQLLKGVYAVLPTEPEQRAIAKALSDVDVLLEGLDRLIAKKRDLKQAAMQQLLTGETRLPWFSGTWKTITLGEIGMFLKGKGIKRDDVLDEGVACIRYGELYTEYNDYITNPRSHISRDVADTALPLKHGDLLFAGSGETAEEIGKCAAYLADEEAYAGGDIVVLRPSGQNSLYLGHLLNHRVVAEQKARLGQGDAVVHISARNLAQVVVKLPPIDEQEAIARVLSDMDSEIEALEKRRAKTADLKQAMMQELLTGKTRLVEPQASDEQTDAASSNAKGHNWAINEAVVIATLVKHFGGEDYPLGRKRYTKLSYLLHRRVEQQAEGYLKKAAGPYNPQTKYGGPEKIAKQNGYITQHKGPKGHSGFIAAGNIARAEGYFEKWYGQEVIQWLEQFRYKKNDDLEVLATVDMAAFELRASGKTVDVAAVKDVITSHPEWEAKLNRAAFSDANIAEAIKQSDALLGSEIAGGSHA